MSVFVWVDRGQDAQAAVSQCPAVPGTMQWQHWKANMGFLRIRDFGVTKPF